MVYRTSHLAAFVLAAVVLTVGWLVGIRYLVEPILGDARALHEFFFNRSWIQWMTLAAFFLTLAILGHRVIFQRGVVVALRYLAGSSPFRPSIGGQSVAYRFEQVRRWKEAHGPIQASRYNHELALQDEAALERIYGLLSHAVQLMMALGFLGTVWGVSQSMSGSFGSLAGASTEILKSILGNFTNGLSTALDTTVLGLISSLITTVSMTAVKWSETHALQALGERVCTVLSIDSTAHSREIEPLQLLQAELSSIAASLAQTTERAMNELVIRSVQVLETKLSAAVQEQLVRIQGHERRVSEALAETLRHQVGTVLEALEKQRAQASIGFTTELQHIAEQLQRAPEVSIRYPGTNGAGQTLSGKE